MYGNVLNRGLFVIGALSGLYKLRYVLQRITGFVYIRHYDFLANRCREAKLAQIRQAIGQPPQQTDETQSTEGECDPYRCPHCGAVLAVGRQVIPCANWPPPTDSLQYQPAIHRPLVTDSLAVSCRRARLGRPPSTKRPLRPSTRISVPL